LKPASFFPGIAWLTLVTVLLCLPGSTLPKNPFFESIHADKWIHISLFAILFLLFARPFRNREIKKKDNWLPQIALGCVCFGIAMEFVQKYWVPNRSFELQDILADTAGTMLGWLISRKIWDWGKKIGPDRNRDRNQN